MNWDREGQRTLIRRGGGERTSTCASMRNDEVQAAGAEIVLPDKYAKHFCQETLCGMRRELLALQAENLQLIRDELIALKLAHVNVLIEVKRLREAAS